MVRTGSIHRGGFALAVWLMGVSLLSRPTQAQMMFAEREVVRMVPRLEMYYSVMKKTDDTDIGLGVETEYTRSRNNGALLTYWGNVWGAGANASLDEDEKITGGYSSNEKGSYRGSFAAVHWMNFALFASDEILVGEYELNVPLLSQTLRRRMEVNSDYHLGLQYGFYFLAVGYSGGRDRLNLNVRDQTGVLYDEDYSFFSHTRYAALSMRGGGDTGISVLWVVKDSPKAMGKTLDLLSYSQTFNRVSLDVGMIRYMYESSVRREEIGAVIQTYGHSRRYSVGFDFKSLSFTVSQEFQEKKNRSSLATVPVLDASTRNMTRVAMEVMF